MRKVSKAFATIARRFSILFYFFGLFCIGIAITFFVLNFNYSSLPYWEISLLSGLYAALGIFTLWSGYKFWSYYGRPHVEIDIRGVTFTIYEPVRVDNEHFRFDAKFSADKNYDPPVDIRQFQMEYEMYPALYHGLREALFLAGYRVDPSKWRTHFGLYNHAKGGKGSWFSIEPIVEKANQRCPSVHRLDYGIDQFQN